MGVPDAGVPAGGLQGNAGCIDPPFEGYDNGANAPENREHEAVLSEHVGDDLVDSSRSCGRG
jgi:hypothetical protein